MDSGASIAGLAALCALISSIIIGLFVKSALSSYLSEKGKNLATKEDVGEITRTVEIVRSEFTALAAKDAARHQLRMAAIDKRLQAHQEAFSMWRSLTVGSRTAEDLARNILRCQEWWTNNCLYLEPEVREAFVKSYMAAQLREELLAARAEGHYILAAANDMFALPDTLFAAIQLPPLTELEKQELVK